MPTILDSRQAQFRGILNQLFPYVSGKTLDILLQSINADLTVPFRVDATNGPSLTVNVGAAIVANSISNRNKSAFYIGNQIPIFTGGTVTFPSSNGGNITTSTGGSEILNLSSGNFVYVLLYIDQSNNLLTLAGTQTSSPSTAIVPSPISNTASIAYVLLSNVGGTVQNVTQSTIYQFGSTGGGSSGAGGGTANEVALSLGSTSAIATFTSPQPTSTYTVLAQINNYTDASPAFIPVSVINKTTSGFTAEWNTPLSTSNYVLDYLVAPGLSLEAGETLIPLGATSITINVPIAFSTTNYVALAELNNLVDANPQFQPVTVTTKNLGSFVVQWNVPTDTANYRISWNCGSYQ